jgi:RNA polymerase sigma factor (sigma-70 family)
LSSLSGRSREQDILRAFLRGDAQACARVDQWCRQIVYSRLAGIPREEQDDLIQESLAGIWKHATRNGFVVRSSFRALVHKIAMARCVDWIRRRREICDLPETLRSSGLDPLDRTELRDEGGRLRLALYRLDERRRRLIQLRFYEEKSYAEIVRELGGTESSWRVRVHQCLQDLRRDLRD